MRLRRVAYAGCGVLSGPATRGGRPGSRRGRAGGEKAPARPARNPGDPPSQTWSPSRSARGRRAPAVLGRRHRFGAGPSRHGSHGHLEPRPSRRRPRLARRDGGRLWRLGQHRRVGVKDAYEACEAAQVLFLAATAPPCAPRPDRRRPCSPCSPGWRRSCRPRPAAPRRAKRSAILTPLPLGFVASVAAGLCRRRARAISRHGAVGDLRRARGCDAGAERACPDARRCPGAAVRHGACFAHDAEQIHDYLPAGARPSVVLMNPPLFGLPEHRGPGCGRGSEASRLGAGPPCRGWAAGRHHRRDPRPGPPGGA